VKVGGAAVIVRIVLETVLRPAAEVAQDALGHAKQPVRDNAETLAAVDVMTNVPDVEILAEWVVVRLVRAVVGLAVLLVVRQPVMLPVN
jgi:hypothetical protein